MLLGESLPFVKDYVASINEAIKQRQSDSSLSCIQCCWLSFVILGILVTNSLCWARIERFSLGEQKLGAMSWMFRRAKIAWDLLLHVSVLHILEKYGIKEGILVIDDTDRERSKNTERIGKAHTIKDKKMNFL